MGNKMMPDEIQIDCFFSTTSDQQVCILEVCYFLKIILHPVELIFKTAQKLTRLRSINLLIITATAIFPRGYQFK